MSAVTSVVRAIWIARRLARERARPAVSGTRVVARELAGEVRRSKTAMLARREAALAPPQPRAARYVSASLRWVFLSGLLASVVLILNLQYLLGNSRWLTAVRLACAALLVLLGTLLLVDLLGARRRLQGALERRAIQRRPHALMAGSGWHLGGGVLLRILAFAWVAGGLYELTLTASRLL